MTWPNAAVSTLNLDQGSDSPALARDDILAAVQNINAVTAEFGNVDLSTPTVNDVIVYSGNQWIAAQVSSYGDANVTTFLSSNFGSNTITTTGNITGGHIIGNGSSLTNTPEKTITLTGDVTASGNTGSNVSVSLSNTAVTAGTYGSATEVAQITVDAQGRVTAAANVEITGGGSTGVGDFALLDIAIFSDQMANGETILSFTEAFDPQNIITLADASTISAGAFRTFSFNTVGDYMIESTGFGVNGSTGVGSPTVNFDLKTGTMSSIDSTITLRVNAGQLNYAGSNRQAWALDATILDITSTSTKFFMKNASTTYDALQFRPVRIKITRVS